METKIGSVVAVQFTKKGNAKIFLAGEPKPIKLRKVQQTKRKGFLRLEGRNGKRAMIVENFDRTIEGGGTLWARAHA